LDGIEVVGEARDGGETVRLARQLRPDVCLTDIRMPVLDGVEATRQLAGPGVENRIAVLVITTFDLDEYVHRALRACATGFLLKDAGARAAGRGDPVGDARRFADLPEHHQEAARDVRGRGPRGPSRQPVDPLTEREEEIILTLARGRTNGEIAADLRISLSTVKTHIASLMAKLGARDRVEVAMWAHETGRLNE
jgi:DNA-binding NarL/FixJ family response regulator